MNTYKDEVLMHDGQKGMKWGRRRYRNYDGTLTPAGRERYGVGTTAQNAVKKLSRKERKAQKEIKRKASAKAAEKAAKQATEESKRAAEEARQAQEELRKAQETAAVEAEKKAKEAKAGHATAEENMQAKLDNDRLREQINALKLEREYESLVHPKNQTPQKKTAMEKALAFVDTAKKVTVATNDVYKMIEDIKKGFKGESVYDKTKKQSDLDKLIYDMEARNVGRQNWAKQGYKIYHSENLDEFLEHHGILGMKWGVRRYQNKDGTLTAAGKKRYYAKDGSLTSEGRKWKREQEFREREPEIRKTIDRLAEKTKDLLPFGVGNLDSALNGRKYDDAMRHRVTEAADLGLAALQKEQRITADEISEDKNGWRSWFLFEDQTLGLGLVADMINQGYTSKQVSDLVDEIKANDRDIYEAREYSNAVPTQLNNVAFDITNGDYKGYLTAFAKDCEEVKKKG